ncbi:MAG: HEAT repeat domain-containing protein, partial [Planctomycetota bacterium]
VRAHAATLLSGSGDSGANAVSKLVGLLADRKRVVRASAESALLIIGASNPDPILDAVDDRLPHVRAAAIRILAEFPELSEQSIPIVLPLLDDEHHEVSKAAISTLGELRAHVAIPALVSLTNHSAIRTRISALRALSKMGHAAQPSLRSILPNLWNKQIGVRLQAEETIVAMIRSGDES